MRLGRLVLGALTLAPIVYILYFFMAVSTMSLGGSFEALVAVHMLVMVLSFGLLVFYTVHVLRRKDMPSSERLLWAILLFVGTLLAMPIYFFLKMKPEPAAAPPA